MLRQILLFFSRSARLKRFFTGWSLSRRVASRFVAGDNLRDALAAVSRLHRAGLAVTLDHLGENVADPDDAIRAAEDYLELLDYIADASYAANISLKLTHLGILFDFEVCLEHLRRIVERARKYDTFVRIDMEQAEIVGDTLAIHAALRREGHANLGVVIQSYLYRSEDDMHELCRQGAKVRLCKGAYDEPPDVAYPEKSEVDENFDRLAGLLIDAAREHGSDPVSVDGRIPPMTAIATHDEARIDHARACAERAGLPKRALEFQLLYGIRPELQKQIASQGYPVRVYVPYGTEWYPYFMRRLAERPANVWFFLSNLFRR